MDMMTAKIFENGGSQAVRLTKEYRFDSDEVSVNKIGNTVLLSPKLDKWESVLQAVDMFSEDYMADGRANKVKIKLIAAIDLHFGLGKNGNLLFKIPEDLRLFKQLTADRKAHV